MKRPYLQRLATTTAVTTAIAAALAAPLAAQDLEIDELTFGFIKLTDMAPLAVAYELGYFEDEGLFVTLEAQANWRVLLDGVIDGTLEGAHMLAGQPIAATIGFGTEAHIVTPFSMDLNGNGITVSNEVWDLMRPHIPSMDDGRPVHPISAEALVPVVAQFRDEGVRLTDDRPRIAFEPSRLLLRAGRQHHKAGLHAALLRNHPEPGVRTLNPSAACPETGTALGRQIFLHVARDGFRCRRRLDNREPGIGIGGACLQAADAIGLQKQAGHADFGQPQRALRTRRPAANNDDVVLNAHRDNSQARPFECVGVLAVPKIIAILIFKSQNRGSFP